ncbi:hypothetical protein [Nocardioides acrostichi]|uniref:Uncharacterized protein n=1 Tax=Nocardioides acrostichi TaxID=2784339 RepID=A0A930V2U9_9ACTN|nr:hypothetical protein [Nocardioides acrostichi]MBF4162782.1 hypothetical protein [Nocardioides acrostichi]
MALVVFSGIGPHVLGYRTMTRLTGSTVPGIEPEDEGAPFGAVFARRDVSDPLAVRNPGEDNVSDDECVEILTVLEGEPVLDSPSADGVAHG